MARFVLFGLGLLKCASGTEPQALYGSSMTTTPSQAQVEAQKELEAAQKEQASAEERAKELLQQLQSWSSEVAEKTGAGTRISMESTVSDIEAYAEKQVESKRKDLYSVYESKLDNLKRMAESPSRSGNGYGGESIEDLARQAIEASDDLGDVYKMKMKAMMDKFKELKNSGKDKAKELQKQVKSEAHRAMQLASKVESLGRKVGQPESEYESNQEKAEHDTEHLSEGAEHIAEKVEESGEHYFEKMEHLLEMKRHEMEHTVEAKEKAREQEVKEVLQQAQAKDNQAPMQSSESSARQETSSRSASPSFLEATGKSQPDDFLRKGLLMPATVLLAALSLAAAAWVRGQRWSHMELSTPLALG